MKTQKNYSLKKRNRLFFGLLSPPNGYSGTGNISRIDGPDSPYKRRKGESYFRVKEKKMDGNNRTFTKLKSLGKIDSIGNTRITESRLTLPEKDSFYHYKKVSKANTQRAKNSNFRDTGSKKALKKQLNTMFTSRQNTAESKKSNRPFSRSNTRVSIDYGINKNADGNGLGGQSPLDFLKKKSAIKNNSAYKRLIRQPSSSSKLKIYRMNSLCNSPDIKVGRDTERKKISTKNSLNFGKIKSKRIGFKGFVFNKQQQKVVNTENQHLFQKYDPIIDPKKVTEKEFRKMIKLDTSEGNLKRMTFEDFHSFRNSQTAKLVRKRRKQFISGRKKIDDFLASPWVFSQVHKIKPEKYILNEDNIDGNFKQEMQKNAQKNVVRELFEDFKIQDRLTDSIPLKQKEMVNK